MTRTDHTPVDLLIRSLELRDVLSASERAVLEALPFTLRDFRHEAEVVAEGSRPGQSALLLSGFACRTRILENGARQITAVHTPGDFVDLHSFTLKVMDHSVVALGPCKFAFVPHESLTRITQDHPHLARLLWLLTTIDAAIQRAWITAGGRLRADNRTAHLVCELYAKLRAIGVVEGDSFTFPARQADIADMTGTSVVHTNRTLQSLRATRLLIWIGDRITIPDFTALAEFALFDPNYLYLKVEPR